MIDHDGPSAEQLPDSQEITPEEALAYETAAYEALRDPHDVGLKYLRQPNHILESVYAYGDGGEVMVQAPERGYDFVQNPIEPADAADFCVRTSVITPMFEDGNGVVTERLRVYTHDLADEQASFCQEELLMHDAQGNDITPNQHLNELDKKPFTKADLKKVTAILKGLTPEDLV